MVDPLEGFIKDIQINESSPDSKKILKLNLVNALIPHAPEKAKIQILKIQEDPNMQQYQSKLIYFLETIERILNSEVDQQLSESGN